MILELAAAAAAAVVVVDLKSSCLEFHVFLATLNNNVTLSRITLQLLCKLF